VIGETCDVPSFDVDNMISVLDISEQLSGWRKDPDSLRDNLTHVPVASYGHPYQGR
jgi:hypothetical protein